MILSLFYTSTSTYCVQSPYLPKPWVLLLGRTSQGHWLYSETWLKLLLRVSLLILQRWLYKAGTGTNSSVYLHLLYCTTNIKEGVCTCICVCLQGDGIRNFPSSILQANPVSSPKIPLLLGHLKKIWGMETVSSKLHFLANQSSGVSFVLPHTTSQEPELQLPLKSPVKHWSLSVCLICLFFFLKPLLLWFPELGWGKSKREVHCNDFVCCHVGQGNKVFSVVKRSQQL